MLVIYVILPSFRCQSARLPVLCPDSRTQCYLHRLRSGGSDPGEESGIANTRLIISPLLTLCLDREVIINHDH